MSISNPHPGMQPPTQLCRTRKPCVATLPSAQPQQNIWLLLWGWRNSWSLGLQCPNAAFVGHSPGGQGLLGEKGGWNFHGQSEARLTTLWHGWVTSEGGGNPDLVWGLQGLARLGTTLKASHMHRTQGASVDPNPRLCPVTEWPLPRQGGRPGEGDRGMWAVAGPFLVVLCWESGDAGGHWHLGGLELMGMWGFGWMGPSCLPCGVLAPAPLHPSLSLAPPFVSWMTCQS